MFSKIKNKLTKATVAVLVVFLMSWWAPLGLYAASPEAKKPASKSEKPDSKSEKKPSETKKSSPKEDKAAPKSEKSAPKDEKTESKTEKPAAKGEKPDSETKTSFPRNGNPLNVKYDPDPDTDIQLPGSQENTTAREEFSYLVTETANAQKVHLGDVFEARAATDWNSENSEELTADITEGLFKDGQFKGRFTNDLGRIFVVFDWLVVKGKKEDIAIRGMALTPGTVQGQFDTQKVHEEYLNNVGDNLASGFTRSYSDPVVEIPAGQMMQVLITEDPEKTLKSRN